MFITFEGGDGAGKSTQINLLAEQLRTQGREVLTLREPGSSKGAEAIRTLVLNGDSNRWHAVEELFLFSAARHELIRTRILPALRIGVTVLCDRFADSSAVYQGRAGGIKPLALQSIEDLATQGLQPDVTFLIDVPVDIGLARAKSRVAGKIAGSQESRFETKDRTFHEDVRSAFLQRAATFPERFQCIDGTKDINLVAAQIWRHVESVFETA